MPDAILCRLNLDPDEVQDLSGKARQSLVAYLLRWDHHDAARRCLQQLLITHSHLVSVYDNLARVHLAEDQADRALEIMRRRHALKVNVDIPYSQRVALAGLFRSGSWIFGET